MPEGKRGKRFSKLSDGITKRRYAVGKVTMIDGRECSLIKIEREVKSLSMLILKTKNRVNWNWIYSKLLIGLVDKSGKWSNNQVNKFENMGIVVLRVKHIKNGVYEHEKSIYKKMI